MTIALIDNGSLAAAAHRNLRSLASALSARVDRPVHAVSWKHSDRIQPAALAGEPGLTVPNWIRREFERGEREFVFVPFFVSPQGAIGTALGSDLEKLQRSVGHFSYRFTEGLAERGMLPAIVVDRIRDTLAGKRLSKPSVIVVDHGGPSAESAALRDAIARDVRARLGAEIGTLAAASLEGEHAPLFVDQLLAPNFDRGDVVVAPLFLSPGRHAGPNGDLAQIVRGAQDRAATLATRAPLNVHFSELVGNHPLVADTLAHALRDTLASLSVAA